MSSQECVYRCLPELWLRKTFPGTIFINTELPEKRIRTRKSDQHLSELEDDSTEIYNSNIIERYSDRPNRNFKNGAFAQVNDLCLAEFAAYYYKEYRPTKDENNDNQPVILTDETLENQHASSQHLPAKISLMTRKETMKCRKVKAVIRFHKPTATVEPEKFFHHILMLYYPWQQESDLIGPDGTYASKLNNSLVRQTVNRNQRLFELHGEAVDEALEYIQNHPQWSLYGERFDAFAEQENSDVCEELLDHTSDNDSELCEDEIHPGSCRPENIHGSVSIVSSSEQSKIDDDSLHSLVRSLNQEQCTAYDIVLTWCRDKVKSLNSEKPNEVTPVHLFHNWWCWSWKKPSY